MPCGVDGGSLSKVLFIMVFSECMSGYLRTLVSVNIGSPTGGGNVATMIYQD